MRCGMKVLQVGGEGAHATKAAGEVGRGDTRGAWGRQRAEAKGGALATGRGLPRRARAAHRDLMQV